MTHSGLINHDDDGGTMEWDLAEGNSAGSHFRWMEKETNVFPKKFKTVTSAFTRESKSLFAVCHA